MTHTSNLKVALCHDYLIKIGGAEKVLEELHLMFPDAPVFTLLYDESATARRYASWDIRTSWLQKAPYAFSKINYYRALMPQAVESFDLAAFDVVISDSSSFIKGVITQPHTLHISYIHTPTRFLWFDLARHITRGHFSALVKSAIPAVLHRIRQWDTVAAKRPDVLIANSKTTQDRIKKFYQRDSRLIYPPVECARFDHSRRHPQDFFLIISRLEPHKEIDTAIAVANSLGVKLKIIGEGGDQTRLRQLAGPSIEFLGWLDDQKRDHYLYHAKALLAPQVEDFGISMVESLAAGCPVITRNSGGGAEIVQDGVNGIVITEPLAEGLAQAIHSFQDDRFTASVCAQSAQRFRPEIFRRNINAIIEQFRERK